MNYRDAKDIADSFFTGDCLQVGLTSPPKAVTLVPNAIKYLVKFVPYIREAKDFAVLRNTNKSVNYNGLIGVLIEAIKELKKEIEELKNN